MKTCDSCRHESADQPLSVCRDLWQLRAEFSRLSSSLLSSCDSVSSSLRLNAPSIKPAPLLSSDLPPPSSSPPLSSTLILPPLDSSPSIPPPVSSSTLGTLTLGELEHNTEETAEEEQGRWEEKEREISELKLLHETKVFQLNER